jgi:hypothetical protein
MTMVDCVCGGTFAPPFQFIRNHFLTLRRPAKLAVSKGAL